MYFKIVQNRSNSNASNCILIYLFLTFYVLVFLIMCEQMFKELGHHNDQLYFVYDIIQKVSCNK